ncbi:MAG: NUDIX domain-containing protein [Kofleriaceae bacterium]|nr:MAG: NUDIX domain-containing protein [Kofleriaceae bacterium]MBZ0238976.1 NUDIX domain-containing protein [Kofleriaceae bacterium]
MIVAVSAIVFEGEMVLVVERGKPPGEGLWSVPGGRLEEGESMVEGVAREVREETGLEVEVGVLVAVLERGPYLIHSHLARVVGGVMTAGDDVRDARFVDEEELARLETTEGLAEVIARARRLT